MDIPAVLNETETWPLEDQMKLMDRIWDRIWNRLIDTGWQAELTDGLKEELDGRLAGADANPSDVVTWDDIVQHVRRKR